jgi:hypothetical protein
MTPGSIPAPETSLSKYDMLDCRKARQSGSHEENALK